MMASRAPVVSRTVLKTICRVQKYSGVSVAEAATKEVALNQPETKKTMIENWIQYWKNVYRDYKSVAVDVVNDMKNNPGKSSLKLLGLGSLGFCAYINPTENDYINELLENQLRLVMVPESIRNKRSEEYIHNVQTFQNSSVLRYQSFGIFSIVYNGEYAQALEVYKKQCDYLHPSYLTFFKEKVVDIGFLNYWYFLNKAMEDYDVNPDEWVDKES